MSRKKQVIAFFIAVLTVCFLTGCADLSHNQGGGYQVTDVEGTVITIAHKPQRILTVSAGTDELMLGLVEPERMAAVNDSLADEKHTNVPWVREKIPTVITRSPSVEQVAALSPDLIIHFPHGRISMMGGDQVVSYLKERNIPVIAPLTLMTSQEEWENDPQGMMGSFLSQTIGVPELDGAIYPYVLTVEEKNADGLYVLKAIPERLRKLTELVQRFLSQPFHVAEQFTGIPGVFVDIKDTIRGFNMILDGELDHLPEAAFNLKGTIEEVIEAGEKMLAEAQN